MHGGKRVGKRQDFRCKKKKANESCLPLGAPQRIRKEGKTLENQIRGSEGSGENKKCFCRLEGNPDQNTMSQTTQEKRKRTT